MTTRPGAAELLTRVAQDPRARRFVESRGVSARLVRRCIAGESLTAELDVTGELLARGRLVSATYLAADPIDRSEAKDRRKRLRKLLRRLTQAGYAQDGRTDISLRLGLLGAHVGRDGLAMATEMTGDIVAGAAEAGTRVTVETEPGLDQAAVLAAVARLRHDLDADVGVALGASVARTETDCAELTRAGVRVRLVRGPVRAPGTVRGGREADRAYVRCLQLLLQPGAHPTVATHDPRLIAIAEELVRRRGLRPDDVEYQLSYGVRPRRQTVVADRGGRMRVYLPYGPDWYPYLVERVAERPGDVPSLLGASGSR